MLSKINWGVYIDHMKLVFLQPRSVFLMYITFNLIVNICQIDPKTSSLRLYRENIYN